MRIRFILKRDVFAAILLKLSISYRGRVTEKQNKIDQKFYVGGLNFNPKILNFRTFMQEDYDEDYAQQ